MATTMRDQRYLSGIVKSSIEMIKGLSRMTDESLKSLRPALIRRFLDGVVSIAALGADTTRSR